MEILRRTIWILAIAAAIGSGGEPRAQTRGRNPFDAEQRRLAAEAVHRGTSPRAILPVMRIWGNADMASAALTREVLRGLSTNRRLSAPVRAYAGVEHAWTLLRAGKVDEAAAAIDALGYVQKWRIVGPFDNEGKAGFDTSMPPEDGRNAQTDLDLPMRGRERDVRWRTLPDVVRWGYVSFDAFLRPNENVCGFAETFVHVDAARPLTLWVGAGGAVKVYFDGDLVLTDSAYRSPDFDRSVALVQARAGWNRILLKACCTDGRWGFYFRLGEADGSPARGVRIDPAGATVAAAAAGGPPARMPTPPTAPLASFETSAAADPPDAQALQDLAELLWRTGGDDPAERRARQLAARAADLGPTAERLVLAANLAEERGEKTRFSDQAVALAPRDPAVQLQHAQLVQGGFEPERALRLYEAISERSPEGTRATMTRAQLFASMGFDAAALRLAADVAARSPGAVEPMRLHAAMLESNGRRDEAIDIRRAILGACHDDFDTRRMIAADALAREDSAEVLRQVETMRALSPDDAGTLQFAAREYEALGREGDALAALQAAVDLAPDESASHVTLARSLLLYGQRDAAQGSLRRALALRPQDANARELLEHIRPERRPDESWVTPTERVLARRRDSAGWPVTVLHDLTVQSVYDNGLSSTFRQVAAQVHDVEGARRWQTFEIPYDPSAQWVDVRLARVHRANGTVLESSRSFERDIGESWYRVYYDMRQLVVVFPDLEPGDTVELRYRVDDVSHRNAFADYYGDLHFLQSGDPVARHEYVLLTPASRTIFASEPRLGGLRHRRRVEGGRRIDSWTADDVPAIRPEAGMPGVSEVVPYLHVSTYRAWQDVGRWWWGLARDSLYADEALRRTVADLVRGAPDVPTKVQRIYAWVEKNTRYVGLEFGIHGFQPYRMPLVVQRGFGDCKDKAGLLYTMLREAGIEARIALVRTRDNGGIGSMPASLAVFDHAIAYVPALDLYLDGTGEASGSMELPEADQGVTVLVVGPDGAELRTTPVSTPASNRRTERLTVHLAADGSADVEGEEEIAGTLAASYRLTYQAEGQRTERLQRALSGLFPGVEVGEQRFERLDDFESPVHYRWRGHVPQMARADRGSLRIAPSSMDELLGSLAPAPTRRYPLELGAPWSYVEERSVVLPPGMRASELPPPAEVASDFGRLAMTIRSDGHAVTARTEIAVSADRIPVARYPAFRRWVEEVDRALRARIAIAGAR